MMVRLFNRGKRVIESGLMSGFVDFHSHILPGVDDGSRSVDESLEMLRWYEELGVKRVTFTPHIMERYPLNNATRLRDEFNRFKGLYNGPVELSLGAEYMLDFSFEKHLESGDILTLWDDHLLLETSFVAAPVGMFERIQRIMSSGYFVVLAHPERYLYMDERDYERLKQMGVLFQLNLSSLLGGYGERVVKRAERLLERGVYDIMGTDLHSLKQYQEVLNSTRVSSGIIKKVKDLKSRLCVE